MNLNTIDAECNSDGILFICIPEVSRKWCYLVNDIAGDKIDEALSRITNPSANKFDELSELRRLPVDIFFVEGRWSAVAIICVDLVRGIWRYSNPNGDEDYVSWVIAQDQNGQEIARDVLGCDIRDEIANALFTNVSEYPNNVSLIIKSNW